MSKILDWNKYISGARTAAAEGCVLLENKNNVLPLERNARVAIFGRMQNNYYKSGTGSGGMVNVAKTWSIVDGLLESGHVIVNETLQKIYATFEEEVPFNEGEGWGAEPWSQPEMELTLDIAKAAAEQSDVAIVIIGRTAGEDKDAHDRPGSYRLTEVEETMLANVREAFDKMVVLLNVGGIMDMSFLDTFAPEAVMYVWQGGMVGGLGVADVLTGKVAPSGGLTDTIAYHLEDYPCHGSFHDRGDVDENIYNDDIFVGYRYFETFAKDKVRYPFGYGLSYTEFKFDVGDFEASVDGQFFDAQVAVTNVGPCSGKTPLCLFVEAPNGVLGKASRVLVGVDKTSELAPEACERVEFHIPFASFASYDTEKTSWVLEEGIYHVFAGRDVRSAQRVGEFSLEDEQVLEVLSHAMAPDKSFEYMSRVEGEREPVVKVENGRKFEGDERRRAGLPCEIEKRDAEKIRDGSEEGSLGVSDQINTNDKTSQSDNQHCDYTSETSIITLSEVLAGTSTLDHFISQLSDYDLSCIIRGEGMGSSLVTPGTASAFGGVSRRLIDDLGVPSVCCSDGPSGMRLDCGVKAFSLPNGTMLGCTFNWKLVEELYTYMGLEMTLQKVEVLLGPGMNIHRYPLNGRNFEYFSEDPVLTGIMASAVVRGLKKAGVSGTLKHFVANNQEYHRHMRNSVVTERALREIYLKPFEIAVKWGGADSIMTSYGPVNGLWTAGNYDLCTTIARNEWGFEGIFMTDWWAHISDYGGAPTTKNFAAMTKAGNDLYMVCPDGSKNLTGDNTLESLENGTLTRAELQRNAKHILTFVMNSQAMKRLVGTAEKVELINRPEEELDVSLDNVEFMLLDDTITIPLNYKESRKGANYIIPLDITTPGLYHVHLTGSSNLTELAQIPCTLFYTSFPIATFTFNGTNGADMTVSRELQFWERFNVMRLEVGRNGVNLKDIKFTLKEKTRRGRRTE